MADNKKLLISPILQNNPIAVQVLGICSALAVTISIKNAIGHGRCLNIGDGVFRLFYFAHSQQNSIFHSHHHSDGGDCLFGHCR